jgi:hypothetical protein
MHRRKRHALHSLPPMPSKAQPIAMLIFIDKQLDRPRRRKSHTLHSLPPMSSKAQPIAMLIFKDKQLDRPRRIFWHCVQYDAVAPQEISHGDRSSEIG